MHQVVGEGVVVVDHEQHDGLNLLARLGSASNEHPGYPHGNPFGSLVCWLNCTGSAGFVGMWMGQGRAGSGTTQVDWGLHPVGLPSVRTGNFSKSSDNYVTIIGGLYRRRLLIES